jgi:serine/threonine-protein kinase
LTIFFSPDSGSVAFVADGKLRRVALDGGSVEAICDSQLETRGGSWGDDGSIIFAGMFGGLMRVRSGGRSAEPLTRLEPSEITHRWPQILPGAQAVLFTSHSAPTWWSRARIEVLALADSRRIVLQEGGTFGRFVTDADGGGYLTFVRSGTLFAAPFDPVRLELLGSPIPVLEHVSTDNGGAAQVDGSRTGTVVTRREAVFNLAWLDHAGATPLFREPGNYHGPAVSHDGT